MSSIFPFQVRNLPPLSSLFLNTQEDFLKTFVCAFDGLFLNRCLCLCVFLKSVSSSSSWSFTKYLKGERKPIIVSNITTGCLYKLSKMFWGPLKCTKSNFNTVHVFVYFRTFCLVALQLILASKLSEFTALPLHNFNVRRGPWHWYTTKLIIYQ